MVSWCEKRNDINYSIYNSNSIGAIKKNPIFGSILKKMMQEERQQIIEVIDRDIKKLTQKITELKEFTAPVSPDNAIGRISRMDAINNKSIVDASMQNLQTRLSQLQKISQVVHEKDFGLCIKCHKPIAFERLKIRPEIRFCAGCLQK